MNKSEVDRYDYTVCPFNSQHRFSMEQYKHHLIRCKDRFFPEVANNICKCPHNPSHLFINPWAYAYHIERCMDFPGRTKYVLAEFGQAPKPVVYRNCIYNPLHGIVQTALVNSDGKSNTKTNAILTEQLEEKLDRQAWEKHLESCPNKNNKVEGTSLPTPALDMTMSGQLNYRHGLLSSDDVSLSADLSSENMNNSIISDKVSIHYQGKNFFAFKEHINKNIVENDIWISQIAFADTREWPGLKLLEDTRSHEKYFIGLLYPDSNSLGLQRFTRFSELLIPSNNNPFSIAVSFQNASAQNIAIFIVHKSEETGFGDAIQLAYKKKYENPQNKKAFEENKKVLETKDKKDEKSQQNIENMLNKALGVFYIPHSLLYNKPSIIDNLQNQIFEKDKHINYISNDYTSMSQEKDRIVDEYNLMKVDFERYKAISNEDLSRAEMVLKEKDRELSKIREEAYNICNEQKNYYDRELEKMRTQIDFLDRERNTAQLNYQSDLQNLRGNSKVQIDKLNQRIAESTAESECIKSELIKYQKVIKDRENQIMMLKEQISRANEKLENTKISQLSPESKILLEEAIKEEKEKFIVEMTERELCIICCTEKKNVLFFPCGHLAYCNVCFCALNLEMNKKIPKNHAHSRCSVCESLITKAIRAFPY
ncbi:hypothetical protein SteCoe_21040 [Stentor coeruleus]|uniref:RING-type domain-containing protein n=1 Tax=Stentor coeruleus TaxID=5963 RepID=A0A1R2BQH5_9CILI|nr:hypothetical protein SteCoe_21040 [Stentor coeruleus]